MVRASRSSRSSRTRPAPSARMAAAEKRELPVYDLVLARADGRLGPGIKSSAVDCVAKAAAERAAAQAAGTQLIPPSLPDFNAPPPVCGSIRMLDGMEGDMTWRFSPEWSVQRRDGQSLTRPGWRAVTGSRFGSTGAPRARHSAIIGQPAVPLFGSAGAAGFEARIVESGAGSAGNRSPGAPHRQLNAHGERNP
jgi:hypothetical protein